MNATMVASNTKAVPPVVSSIQDVPLAKIRESKTNPRRFFDEAKLAELADNIRQHGVLQPILLRPLPEREAGTYELVAGTRRYRASRLAKRESIPATVRELTDAQALELQVIELSIVRNSFLCWPRLGTLFTCKRCMQINVSIPDDYRRKQVVCVRDCPFRRISTLLGGLRGYWRH